MRNLKKTIISLAATLAMGTATFAADFGGQYAGQSEGTQFGISLQQQQGQIAGALSVGGQQFAIAGETDGRSIRGTIRGGSNGDLPFTAYEQNGQLIIMTQNGQMSCQRSGGTTNDNFCGTGGYTNDRQVPQNENFAQPGMSSQPRVQIQSGRFFQFAVPEGWQVNETANVVDMCAPDRSAATQMLGLYQMYGHIDADGFFMKTQELNRSRVQVTSRKSVQLPGYTDAAVYEFDLQGADGRMYHGQSLVGVASGNGRYSAGCITAMSRAELWNQYASWLPKTAMTIQASSSGALGAGAMTAAATPRYSPSSSGSLNQPMGDWRPYDASASNDRLGRARSEATLGFERMEDRTTGEKYYPTPDTYDASRGGYVNPVRPTETLDRVPDGE